MLLCVCVYDKVYNNVCLQGWPWPVSVRTVPAAERTVPTGSRLRTTPDAERRRTVNAMAAPDRTSQAYRQLRDLIVQGRLAPGARIIETEIASKLGLSRTPVRSALQRLQQEGHILDTGSGRRTRPVVAPVTREDAQEVFEIVGELEGLGARRAAGLPTAAREALCQELDHLNAAMREFAGTAMVSDRNKVFDVDTDFHHGYVAAGAGPRLKALHDAVKPQAERYIRLHINVLVDELRTSVAEHQVIVDAIREGAASRAQRAVQTNWRNAADRVGRVIDQMGERGTW